MLWNVLVLASVLLAATAAGLLLRRHSGHFRGAPSRRAARAADADSAPTPSADETSTPFDPADLQQPFGQRATLVQFSSAFCAPCRVTRRVLADVAAVVPGVAHIEVDAEQRLDLVRRVGVLRTPTTLVLDATGREISRATGAPTKPDVLAALGRAIDAPAID